MKFKTSIRDHKSAILTVSFIVFLILLLFFNLYLNSSGEVEEKEEINYIHNVTNSNFDSILAISDTKLILLNFSLPTSKPCQDLDTVYSQLASHFKDSLLFCSLNVDSLKKITQDYKISSIPTLKLIYKQKEFISTVGYLKQSEILFLIDKIISEEKLNEIKKEK